MNQEIVDKKELAEILNVKIRQIGNYTKKGMPIHGVGKRNAQSFNKAKCIKWRDENINQAMASKTSTAKMLNETIKADSNNTKEIEVKIYEEPDDVAYNVAKKLKLEVSVLETKDKHEKLKLALARGEVVNAEDLDRSMSELAIVHRTDKIHDENLLPTLLEHKDAGEIKILLQDHNFERLKMLDGIINKEFKSKETLYDITEAVLNQLKSGVEFDIIIKRVNGDI